MHIVHLLASLQTGGSELVVVELSEAARAAGHRVTVIAARGDLQHRLEASGSEVLNWPLGRKSLRSLRLIPRLANWLGKQSVDIVHVHSRLPAWFACYALRRLSANRHPVLVSTVHGHYSTGRYSAIMTRGRRVIAVSESIATYIKNHYPEVSAGRVVVIPPGADRRIFRWQLEPSRSWKNEFEDCFPASRGRRLLLLPGRITRLKGHKTFIRLLRGLLDAGQPVHGLLAGPVSDAKRHYLDELAELAGDLGIAEHLDYCGNRRDMAELMAHADLVFNLSIKAEAFGRTINEALSVGTPVIAWNRGGAAEILATLFPEGAVPAGDETGLLATSLRLLRQPAVVQADNPYSLEASNRKTLALYAELLT